MLTDSRTVETNDGNFSLISILVEHGYTMTLLEIGSEEKDDWDNSKAILRLYDTLSNNEWYVTFNSDVEVIEWLRESFVIANIEWSLQNLKSLYNLLNYCYQLRMF
jgi:hypothetical protein